MATLRFLRAPVPFCVAVLSLTAAAPGFAQSAPTVYQDDYVTVRAGIAEAGRQPVHPGDAVSLLIDVVFDARQVQIENLGDELFQRAFAGSPSIRLYAPAVSETANESGDRVRVRGRWQLQILDCPAEMPSCPGDKSYELPIMTISYQLTGGGAGGADSRSARFRPWPGTLAVASAIAVMPAPGTELTDVLPGGAFAPPEPVAQSSAASTLLLAAGALLFATGFFATMRQRHPDRVPVRHHHNDTRWEHALTRLRDESVPDAEWSDLLRRCLTWYCMDELGRNPYGWLGAAASDAARSAADASDTRDFFLDVLRQESIARDERRAYLDKLQQLTGQVGRPAASGQPG